jgi:hypothetical protein
MFKWNKSTVLFAYVVIFLMMASLNYTPPSTRATSIEMDINLKDSNASFLGDYQDHTAYAVAGAGDVNHDGYDDFLISVEVYHSGTYRHGHVFLVLGNASGWSMDTDLSEADASFRLEDSEGNNRIAIAGAGDVNGDGFDDILISSHRNNDGGGWAGQTYLILGKASGWAMDVSLKNADASFWGEDSYDHSGYSIDGAGDVNGDGFDDILIGAYLDEDGAYYAGQTYLILGKPYGWAMDTSLADADASFWGEEEDDHSGWSVAGIGDVNGDTYDDILIGAYGNSEGGDEAGQTYLFLGKALGWDMDMSLADADASFWGENDFDHSGYSVAGTGDVNHDGLDDFLIGAWKNDEGGPLAGQTYLVLGKTSGWEMDVNLSAADASFLGEVESDWSGRAVAGAGDVDGDGYDDILIGALNSEENGKQAGQTYLVLGRQSGWTMDINLSTADASFWGERAYDGAGRSVAGAGDVNGDGQDDILIGAWMNDDGGVGAGQTYLVLSQIDPPEWLSVPDLQAVEDVPLTYNFSAHVSDPDTPLEDLTLTSSLDFVTSISGLEVTFEFMDGITEMDVPLVLSDGTHVVEAIVAFTVEPVNDPPEHTLSENMAATEDVPRTINMALYIWDDDNDFSELSIIEDSPYATVDGLYLTLLFPEGVLEHAFWFNISDGQALTEVLINFTVTPVDDPPQISDIDEFTAIEHEVSILDLTSYISDVDTPVEDLEVEVSDPTNCTVVGRELQFLYMTGGEDHHIAITVSDGNSEIIQIITVSVIEVNDPPEVTDTPSILVPEDMWWSIDLADFLRDEETPSDRLRIECEHPAVFSTEWSSITLFYSTWEEPHTIQFSVSDGLARTDGTLEVEVMWVNDIPVLTGIGDLDYPVEITIDERSESWYPIHATDEESTSFEYSVESDWTGITALTNGSLHIVAEAEDIGTHTASVVVDDGDGGIASWDITIIVENVNDPPGIAELLPANGTVYKKGKPIEFMVTTFDEDGDIVSITWKEGELVLSTDSTFEYSKLSKGEHTITVLLDDGTVVTEETLTVIVREDKEETPMVGIAGMVASVMLASIVTFHRRDR